MSEKWVINLGLAAILVVVALLLNPDHFWEAVELVELL